MMPLSLQYYLFYQCAVLLVSFEVIVCPYLDFVIESFGVADIYSQVVFEGIGKNGRFIFKKRDTIVGYRQIVVPVSKILRSTLNQELNDLKVVSFSISGASKADCNLKFAHEWEARHFVTYENIPVLSIIKWARIYSNWRPAIMTYEFLDDDDIGFKLLDNDNYATLSECLHEVPYLFKRSEVKNEIRTAAPHTLYLRNTARAEDYEIMFQSTGNLGDFLKLFPRRLYNECKTVNYYFMPYMNELQ